MKQINPLQIAALLLVMLLFAFFKLNSAKVELKEAQANYKESEKLALELYGLKEVYANKKYTQRALERILRQPSLKKANVKTTKTKTGISIKVASLDYRGLNSFMGKILNGNYNIVKLKIKRETPQKASLAMEIKW